MSDEDRLKRAARKLRAAAAAANHRSPWAAGEDVFEPHEVYVDARQPVVELGCDEQGEANADYIAAMHPPVGANLADLLEAIAPLAPYWAEPYAAPFVPVIEKALRVAREILREAS